MPEARRGRRRHAIAAERIKNDTGVVDQLHTRTTELVDRGRLVVASPRFLEGYDRRVVKPCQIRGSISLNRRDKCRPQVRKGVKMSEGAGSRANAHPTDLWRQWYDANSRMWSNVMGGDKEAYMDPFGLYRQWFGNLEEIQKPTSGAASSQEIWRQGTEAAVEAWHKTFGIGAALAGLAPHWAEMAEGIWEQMFEGGKPPTDPLDFYLRWYNATNVPLSKMIRKILEDESFLKDSRRFLENFATLEQVFQRASEEYFGYLQLTTRSDNTRVAELVVGLDAKVDRMEEAFEEFEHGYATPASAVAVEVLEERVKQLERKLDDNRSGLQRMEGKLDQLLAALGNSTNGGSPATGSQEEVEATDAARRKARELGINLREVQGSGTGGRITVEDVRKKGEAG